MNFLSLFEKLDVKKYYEKYKPSILKGYEFVTEHEFSNLRTVSFRYEDTLRIFVLPSIEDFYEKDLFSFDGQHHIFDKVIVKHAIQTDKNVFICLISLDLQAISNLATKYNHDPESKTVLRNIFKESDAYFNNFRRKYYKRFEGDISNQPQFSNLFRLLKDGGFTNDIVPYWKFDESLK